MGDGDLKDSAVEAGMIGQRDTDQTLQGKHYNNDICLHITLAEAVTPKKIEKFMGWLQLRNKCYVRENIIQNQEFERMIAKPKHASFNTIFEIFEELIHVSDECETNFCNWSTNPMAAYG